MKAEDILGLMVPATFLFREVNAGGSPGSPVGAVREAAR